MNLKFKTKPALITTVIILTGLLSWLVGSVTEQEMRNAFILQTQIGANAIDVNRIKKLTGTSADLKSPDYLQLKQQFASIMKVNKDQRFVYLMGINKNNKIFFYVDDRPDGDPQGSPPGSTYDEASKEFNQVMRTGIPTIVGPYSDRWGSFASGCAPVIDPKTGKTIAIFAIDFATNSWYWNIVLHSALPIALVILLMLALLTTMASRQRGIQLKKSEEKYRFMFNNNPQPNYIYDTETLAFLEVNNAAINHYDYSREEFLSMTLKDIRPIEDIPALLENVKLISQSLNNAGEWRHIKKNGDLIYVEIVSHTVTYNGRDARHVLVHDITIRKLAEDALKQANDELEKLHNNLDEAVFTVDVIHNKILYASVAHQTVFGHAPAEFFKNTQLWYEIIVPEDKSIVDAGFPVLASGEKLTHEYRIAHPNGVIHWIEAKMNPTLDDNGKLIRIDGIASNITERKKLEETLRESKAKYQTIFESTGTATFVIDEDTTILMANNECYSVMGYTATEIIGQKWSQHVAPESLQEMLKNHQLRRQNPDLAQKKYEVKLVIKGEILDVIVDIGMIPGSKQSIVSVSDITERKRMEQGLIIANKELNNSKQELRKFASHLQNVREEEKVAIAREIHDDLGQILVALKIDMGLLKNKVIKTIPLADSSEIQPKFDNIVALINNSIKTARNIMNDLRPELLELNGLVGASKEYLREFEKRYHISCEFDCDISDIKMNPQQSLALFRILQEAMNNIVKHAKATLVQIQLQNSDNKVILQINDNGVGYDKNNSGRNDSYGLIGMKERVILLQGALDITSEFGHGTNVRVEIPHLE